MTINVSGSGRTSTSWVRVLIYDQNGNEVTRTSGNNSGMGSASTLPVALNASAPNSPGTYTWEAAWFSNDSGSMGTHGEMRRVSTNAFTVTAPADTSAPFVGTFTLPATSTSLTVPVSALTATDNVAVTGYLVTTSNTAPAANAAGWTATAPSSVTAPAEGNITFYAWAKDAAGNVSTAKTASVSVSLPDAIAPTVGNFILPATASSLTVPVTTLAATDNVAVTGYLVTTSSTAPAASASGWTATAPANVTAPAEGSITFYAWAKDAAGNVSTAKTASVSIALADTSAPVVGTFTLPATATSLTVPVSALTATDNVAVTGYLVTTSSTAPAASAADWTATAPGSVTAPTEGNVTFYAWAKDAAGNVSTAKTAIVTISVATMDPTLTISTLADGSFTNEMTLNVNGNATDSDGIQSITVNGEAVALNSDGSFSTAIILVAGPNTITVVATDNSGAQTSDTRTITYDQNAPVLTISAPADNSTTTQQVLTLTGTINEMSVVYVNVNDSGTQPATILDNSYTATVYLAVGINTINVTATDLAGNVTTAKRTITFESGTLSLEVTRPGQDITTSKSELELRGQIFDTSGDVTLLIAMNGQTYSPKVEDDGKFEQKLTFTDPKLYVITLTATDEAGNTGSIIRNVIFQSSSEDEDHDGGKDHEDHDRKKDHEDHDRKKDHEDHDGDDRDNHDRYHKRDKRKG